jgi:hypothetical protein
MLELLYTSNKTLTLATFGSPVFFAYEQAWDAFLFSDGQKLYKVFRDGSQFSIGVPPGGAALDNRLGSRHFWQFNGLCYGADDFTGQYDPLALLNPSWTIPAAVFVRDPGNFLDDEEGLYLVRAGSGRIAVYRLGDGTLLNTITVPGSPYYDNLVPVRPGYILALHAASGQAALLDYLGSQVVWQGTVLPFRLAAYDARYNLIVTFQPELALRIYLLTTVPTSLSNPEFYPTVSRVERLTGYPVRVRLTGVAGEPCPDYVVNWAPPNLGFLEKVQSLTDQDGYAWNFYFGPAAAVGTETIQAEVVI